jgi:hypothetical protein
MKKVVSLFFLIVLGLFIFILSDKKFVGAAYLTDPVSPGDVVEETESDLEEGEKIPVIGPLPDLIIKKVSVLSDEATKLSVTYCNIGADAQTDTSQISIILDSGSAAAVEVITMPASLKCITKEHGDFSALNLKPGGSYSVSAYLDKNNLLKEANENNNSFIGEISQQEENLIVTPEIDYSLDLPSVEPIDTEKHRLSLCLYYQDLSDCSLYNNLNVSNLNVSKTNSKVVVSDSSRKSIIALIIDRLVSNYEKQVMILEEKLTQVDAAFSLKHAGRLLLDVENYGRLWYVDPETKNRFYFQDGASALQISSKLALGINYEDIIKIPVGIFDQLYNLDDSDGDGLPDRLEDAIGSNTRAVDSDNDGHSDREELLSGYLPSSNEKCNIDSDLISRLEGKMLIQVNGPFSHGEIWYVHNGKRWYGGTSDSMYEIMKAKSLGAKASDIRKINVGGIVSDIMMLAQ